MSIMWFFAGDFGKCISKLILKENHMFLFLFAGEADGWTWKHLNKKVPSIFVYESRGISGAEEEASAGMCS